MDAELLQLSQRLGAHLKARGWRLSTAESCTGGWIAAVVTATAGSSNWFERGFVTYSNAAKTDMLGVAPGTLAEHGAVSEATVTEMAHGALERSGAEIALAVSGIAGPDGGSAAKPVGTVCLAWARAGGEARAATFLFGGDRNAVRRQALERALAEILRFEA